MAKKKKTRQQKIIADLRRQIPTSQNLTVSYEPKREAEKIQITQLPKVSTFKNPGITTINPTYLIKDLQKTTILSLAIVAGQFILLFLLKNHIISIGGLSY
jgi:hypothetical protein